MAKKKPIETIGAAALRMRKLAERKKQGYVIPRCKSCGGKCTAPSSIKTGFCSDCRRNTEEYRQQCIARSNRSYARAKLIKSLGINLTAVDLDWTPASDRLPESPQEVLVETIRGVWCLASYQPEKGWLDATDKSVIKIKYWTPLVINQVSQEASLKTG